MPIPWRLQHRTLAHGQLTTSDASPLFGFASSAVDEASPDDDNDSNDNGIGDELNPSNGIRSAIVTLEAGGTEPAHESDLVTGDNPQGTADSFANMIVDFGFFSPSVASSNQSSHSSILGIVSGKQDENDNGEFEDPEKGIPNVIVRLYLENQ